MQLPAGPPRAQDQCRLFKLPAEIRNYIYELALAVEPDELGELFISRRLSPSEDTVLNMLGSCRLIYQEAAGESQTDGHTFSCMQLRSLHLKQSALGYFLTDFSGLFYLQHPIRIRACLLQNNGNAQHGIIAKTSQLRLQGLQNLRITFSVECAAVGFEQVTMACKRVKKLPALKTLGLFLSKYYYAPDSEKEVKAELALLKRAVSRLAFLTDLKIEFMVIPANRDQVRAWADEIEGALPSKKRGALDRARGLVDGEDSKMSQAIPRTL